MGHLLCRLGLHKWKHEVKSRRWYWASTWVWEHQLDFVYAYAWELPTGRKRCYRCGKETG